VAHSVAFSFVLFVSSTIFLFSKPVLVINMNDLYQGTWEMCKQVLSEETLARVIFLTKAGLQSLIAPENLLPGS